MERANPTKQIYLTTIKNPRSETKRQDKLLRLLATTLLPKRKRTVLLLIAGVLIIAVFSYAFLPATDISPDFPSFQSFTSEVASTNFSRLLLKYLKPRREYRVSCAAIIDGSVPEIEKARQLSRELHVTEVGISPELYIHLSRNCTRFQQERGYIMNPLSWEEFRYPIAFSILVYTEIEMAERLLRAIYRPQNYYCIHVDAKSEEIYRAFVRIASCFPNVMLAKTQLSVVWGSFTVLDADLVCMETLWPFKRWKYFINLTGQEFPLKPNRDLVKILKALDGANDVHATLSETYEQRWRYRFHVPPTWFQPVKGSVHVTISRAFVDYVLHNKTAAQILKWVKKLDYLQDEAFFSTLNHNPQLMVPGSYKEQTEERRVRHKDTSVHVELASVHRLFPETPPNLVPGDLPLMLRSVQFFANKFFLSEDRIVINCLEEWLYNSTRDSFLDIRHLDVTYYHNLDIVKNQIKVV